jgi:hypothetical protein
VRASPTERAQHAMALARGYGVELTPREAAQVAEAGQAAGQAAPEGFSPAQIEQLNRMLSPVLAPIAQTTKYVNKQLSDAATREVDTFFSDAKNEFVNEVADDILQLMQTGKAETLAEAYELAVMRNPEVKAKYLTKLATLAAPAPSTAVKLPNVKSSATPARNGAKAPSMDDTFKAVLAKHYS